MQKLVHPFPVAQRHLSTTTPSLAHLQLAHLPSRKVIAVSGRDATKFLQGMITNDLNKLHASPTASSPPKLIYAAFLNAPGRVMQDAFIHLHPSSTTDAPVYLVEHDATLTAALRQQMKRFILRAKVKVDDVSSEWSISHLFGRAAVPESLEFAADTRARGMGWRLLHPSNDRPGVEADVEEAKAYDYALHRILLGVPEGPQDIATGNAIPLESNIDYMGGIDFTKGCYVGQELTARTHHTGVTRKRIVPVRLFRHGDSTPTSLVPPDWLQPTRTASNRVLPQPQVDIRPEVSAVARPRPSGKMGSSLFMTDSSASAEPLAVGLALLRLEQMQVDEGIFVTSLPASEEGISSAAGGQQRHDDDQPWRLKAFLPDWWADKAAAHVAST